MVEQDYYELLGIAARRGRRGDQGRLSQAGQGMPSRPPQRLHATRKRSSRRSAKPMTSSRTRRSAPPTTASAMPRSRTAAAATRSAKAGFNGFSDIFSTIFGEFMDPRGARQNAARGADLRYDLELTLEEAFTGVEKTITVEALATCEPCHGRGCTKRRPLRQHLPDLRRHGQGPRAAGLLRRRARLPDLPRLGRSDRRSLRQLPRRGPRAQRSASCR